jgi:hypothetical protein
MFHCGPHSTYIRDYKLAISISLKLTMLERLVHDAVRRLCSCAPAIVKVIQLRLHTVAKFSFKSHFDHFITERDMQILAGSGITHLHVPLPHWIMGDVTSQEPWIVGKRWEAFVTWAQKYHLQVWPDMHTVPGSQNGFDNSGQALAVGRCHLYRMVE